MSGLKYDQGKPRPTLLLRGLNHALHKVLEVLEYGARKYAPNSWQTVPDAKNRYEEALCRHLLAFQQGELQDQESRLDHLAHIATNALFLLCLYKDDYVKNTIKVSPPPGIPGHRWAVRETVLRTESKAAQGELPLGNDNYSCNGRSPLVSRQEGLRALDS